MTTGPYTPAQLAERWGVSERALRKRARELGACRVIGKGMWLNDDDVRTIEEAQRCRSKSTSVAMSGITAARLPAGGYEAARASLDKTKPPRRTSQRKWNRGNGKVVSMVRDLS